IRPILSPADPADALASYYALWHDPRRTKLTLHFDRRRQVDGFVAVCQTGADLFRPLVTLRAPAREIVHDLLAEALAPNRPYHVIAPVLLASAVRDLFELSQSRLNRIYTLDPARFEPVINVLVRQTTSADGALRFQIESKDGEVVALSGVNWRSPAFAEVFVYVHPQGRERGWGKSVVSACTTALLEDRVRPLYIVDQHNEASIAIAEGLGYVDTGVREFSGEGQLKES
ncbi:MAG: GNAT family N-acetyltransferase, partial [Anaerolineae bacterium]